MKRRWMLRISAKAFIRWCRWGWLSVFAVQFLVLLICYGLRRVGLPIPPLAVAWISFVVMAATIGTLPLLANFDKLCMICPICKSDLHFMQGKRPDARCDQCGLLALQGIFRLRLVRRSDGAVFDLNGRRLQG